MEGFEDSEGRFHKFDQDARFGEGARLLAKRAELFERVRNRGLDEVDALEEDEELLLSIRNDVKSLPMMGSMREKDLDLESTFAFETATMNSEGLDEDTVNERLAQLEEEEREVKQFLLRESKNESSSLETVHLLRDGDEMERSTRFPTSKRREDAEETISLLRPVLEETFELFEILRIGSRMRLVVSRNDPRHLCVWAHMRVNRSLDRLVWTTAVADHGKNNYSAETYAVALSEIGAIFCGGNRESAAMDAQRESVFRLHFHRNDLDPLQIAAQDSSQRQAWVAGLLLFRHLFCRPPQSSSRWHSMVPA